MLAAWKADPYSHSTTQPFLSCGMVQEFPGIDHMLAAWKADPLSSKEQQDTAQRMAYEAPGIPAAGDPTQPKSRAPVGPCLAMIEGVSGAARRSELWGACTYESAACSEGHCVHPLWQQLQPRRCECGTL